MSELIDALNQLQKEKHIEKEVIMQAIEDSLVAACNRDFGKNAIVKVNMDRDTGDFCLCRKDSCRGSRRSSYRNQFSRCKDDSFPL